MAACGSLEHIFNNKPSLPETPSFLESLSPWKKPFDESSSSSSNFTEIFGELHFKETHNIVQEPSPSPSSSSYNKHSNSFSSTNSESLSLCTEGLGFESFDNVDDLLNNNEWRDHEKRIHDDASGRNIVQENHSVKRSLSSRVGKGVFPPPISCIGRRSGKPWVSFKSYREDGRFILKEIRVPTQEFLHACRENGRLRLKLVHSDDDNDDDDDDDDEDEILDEDGENRDVLEDDDENDGLKIGIQENAHDS